MASRYGNAFDWTEQNVERMIAVLLEGASFSAIAIELFGTREARSAVAGKMHRMGLQLRPDIIAARLHHQQLAREQQRKKSEHVARLKESREKDGPPRDMVPPDRRFNCTLLELTNENCHYPIGDPQSEDFRFCGMPGASLPGPYCSHCHDFLYPKRPPNAVVWNKNSAKFANYIARREDLGPVPGGKITNSFLATPDE